MGFVVDDVIARMDGSLYRYAARDWRTFCRDHGITYYYGRFPQRFRAMFHDDVLYLDGRLSEEDEQFLAWHEIGHWACHVGSREVWRRMACGNLITWKQERQADDFAALYPIWDYDAPVPKRLMEWHRKRWGWR